MRKLIHQIAKVWLVVYLPAMLICWFIDILIDSRV